jgi:hypothetical protein
MEKSRHDGQRKSVNFVEHGKAHVTPGLFEKSHRVLKALVIRLDAVHTVAGVRVRDASVLATETGSKNSTVSADGIDAKCSIPPR